MTVRTSPAPITGATALQDPWTNPELDSRFRVDGVTNDYSGTSWRVTSDGSSTTVTVGSVGNTAILRGHNVTQSEQETVTLGSIGSQPVGSQERYSRIVLRMDLATYEASVEAITGTPASPNTGVVPNLVRNGSSYDLPLAIVRQVGSAAITQVNIADQRQHVGESITVPEGVSVPALPVGSTIRRGGSTFRVQLVAGAVTTVNAEARVTATLSLGSSVVATGQGGFVSTPYVSRDPSGRVQWHGEINSQTSIAKVFAVAPAGFRPPAAEMFLLPYRAGDVFPARAVAAYVSADGTLKNNTPAGGGVVGISLSGISYYAAGY